MNLTRRKFGKLIAGLMGGVVLPPVALALVKSPSITPVLDHADWNNPHLVTKPSLEPVRWEDIISKPEPYWPTPHYYPLPYEDFKTVSDGDTFLHLATNQTYVRAGNQWIPLGNVVA